MINNDGALTIKKNIPRTILVFALTVLISCHNVTTKPNHFTDEFNFTDKDGNQDKFYGYKNIDSAMFWAKKENRRLLIIFSGYACMSVSGLEWRTLSVYGDNNKIQNNFILVWLPVDDKTIASDTNHIVHWHDKDQKLITIGDQNKFYQEILTNTNIQPTMCFIEKNRSKVANILGYSKEPSEVKAFINMGLDPNAKTKTVFFPPVSTQCEILEGDTL